MLKRPVRKNPPVAQEPGGARCGVVAALAGRAKRLRHLSPAAIARMRPVR